MLVSGLGEADETAGTQSYEFNVLLGTRLIGTHRFDVFRTAGVIDRVESAASFDVRLLGVRVYRYRHQAIERWQQGCLHHLQSSTDDNGDQLKADVRPAGTCLYTYAYWDPRFIGATSLLNPQTGQLDRVSFMPMGREQIEVLGESVPADRQRLVSAALTIDLWYSPDGEWLQLDSTTADGRQVRYRLKSRGGS